MFQIRRLAVLARCCAVVAGALGGIRAVADDARALPAGLRVFYTGHSFSVYVVPRIEKLVESAGIRGHWLAGRQGISGSGIIQHWDLPVDQNQARRALQSGEVDVFTMAPNYELPDPGIDKLTELGLLHNPDLRFLVQASWMAFDATSPQRLIRNNAERDNTRLDELEAFTVAWRTRLEAQVDALNQLHGRQAVFIIPVGDAVHELRKRIVAGKWAGVTKQSELFSDPIGHPLGHVQALAAYCYFAAIYRRSPEGLELYEPGVSDEQHAMLQKIAWETVSAYSYSGVPKP